MRIQHYILNLMETVLLVAALVAIAGFYFLYYEPKKRI